MQPHGGEQHCVEHKPSFVCFLTGVTSSCRGQGGDGTPAQLIPCLAASGLEETRVQTKGHPVFREIEGVFIYRVLWDEGEQGQGKS